MIEPNEVQSSNFSSGLLGSSILNQEPPCQHASTCNHLLVTTPPCEKMSFSCNTPTELYPEDRKFDLSDTFDAGHGYSAGNSEQLLSSSIIGSPPPTVNLSPRMNEPADALMEYSGLVKAFPRRESLHQPSADSLGPVRPSVLTSMSTVTNTTVFQTTGFPNFSGWQNSAAPATNPSMSNFEHSSSPMPHAGSSIVANRSPCHFRDHQQHSASLFPPAAVGSSGLTTTAASFPGNASYDGGFVSKRQKVAGSNNMNSDMLYCSSLFDNNVDSFSPH